MVQNTQATNLAQVLEVLWTKIAECIDEKKSMVLYFDACTVCSPGHVHARCRHAHRSTLQTHRHMRTRSARKGCKVRAERAVRRVTWPRRPCIRVSSHTHTHTHSLSLSLSRARARARALSFLVGCLSLHLSHPPTNQALQNPVAVNRLASHMDVCADCCETFGTSLKLSAGTSLHKHASFSVCLSSHAGAYLCVRACRCTNVDALCLVVDALCLVPTSAAQFACLLHVSLVTTRTHAPTHPRHARTHACVQAPTCACACARSLTQYSYSADDGKIAATVLHQKLQLGQGRRRGLLG